MYQATRIFASNLNAKQCERFYQFVLLPRIRDDFAEFKKLNCHLFLVCYLYSLPFILPSSRRFAKRCSSRARSSKDSSCR